MNKKKSLIFFIIIFFVVLVIGFGIFLFVVQKKYKVESKEEPSETETVTVTEAKIEETVELEEEITDFQLDQEGEFEKHLIMDGFLQFPELPTGCEAVSLTNVLNYYGFNLDKFEIVDNYLLYATEEYPIGFGGNPYEEEGTCIFPKGIVDTANNFLTEQDSDLRAYEISGTDFSDLYEYIQQGIPVLLWVTDTWDYPEYSDVIYQYENYIYYDYYEEHCVVFSGYYREDNVVEIQDPHCGIQVIDRDTIESVYDACGMLAVIIA